MLKPKTYPVKLRFSGRKFHTAREVEVTFGTSKPISVSREVAFNALEDARRLDEFDYTLFLEVSPTDLAASLCDISHLTDVISLAQLRELRAQIKKAGYKCQCQDPFSGMGLDFTHKTDPIISCWPPENIDPKVYEHVIEWVLQILSRKPKTKPKTAKAVKTTKAAKPKTRKKKK